MYIHYRKLGLSRASVPGGRQIVPVELHGELYRPLDHGVFARACTMDNGFSLFKNFFFADSLQQKQDELLL